MLLITLLFPPYVCKAFFKTGIFRVFARYSMARSALEKTHPNVAAYWSRRGCRLLYADSPVRRCEAPPIRRGPGERRHRGPSRKKTPFKVVRQLPFRSDGVALV